MELKLNIYKGKTIEKTYKAETFDIMFGTVEDLLNIIDLEKLNSDTEIAKLIIKVFPLLKPLLKDVFEGVTDDELRRTKIKELIPLFVNIFVFALKELNSNSSKN